MRAQVILSILALMNALLMTGCRRRADIWVVAGSTAAMLTFGVAENRGGDKPIWSLADVWVETCYEPDRPREVLWKASGPDLNGGIAPTRIRYGLAPAGFTTQTGPHPLTPGCFEATISGEGVTASERFVVDTAGAVRSRA